MESTLTQQVDTAMNQLYDRMDNMNESDMPVHLNTSEAGTTDQLYAQVDKKNKKMKKDEVATHSHTPEADAPMDQLYAQVDKKKAKKGEVVTNAPMDHLYAQVDKKNKQNCEAIIYPDADTAVNQLYA